MSYNETHLYPSSATIPSGTILTASASGLETALLSGGDTNVKTYTNLPEGTYLVSSLYTIEATSANTTYVSSTQDMIVTNITRNVTSQFSYPITLADQAVVTTQFTEMINVTSNTNSLAISIKPVFNAGTMVLNAWTINVLKL